MAWPAGLRFGIEPEEYSIVGARLRHAGGPFTAGAAAAGPAPRRGEFKLNLTARAFLQEMSEAIGDVMLELAEEGTRYGKSISPRYEGRSDYPPREHYQDHFEVIPEVTNALHPRLVARDPVRHAVAVEFGSGGNPGYRVMGRTMDHIGPRFVPQLSAHLSRTRR